jgi:hypothetical protein
MFGWGKSRGKQKPAGRDDAEHHDEMSLAKMSKVGFAAPARIRRSYRPARIEQRGSLRVFIFAEEEIVPWPLGKR